jgi:hypothetical protein
VSQVSVPEKLTAAAKAAFVVLAAGFAASLLAAKGADILAAIRGADPVLLGFAFLAACANLLMAALSWRCLVPADSGPLGKAFSARIFFLSQLGKYLPGGIWSFVAATEMGRAAGFARQPILASFILALVVGAGSGLALAVVVVPRALADSGLPGWLPFALPTAAVGAFFARPLLQRALASRLAGLAPPTAPKLILSTLLAIAGWLAAGLMVGALLIALGTEPDLSLLITATGAYALAWIVGFAVVVAPAGIAVREAALIAVLASQANLADASAAAILARAVVTAADLLAGLAAALIPSARPAPAPVAARDRA